MALSSTSFRPRWKAGPTSVIRVPTAFVEQILDYARRLDTETKGEIVAKEPTALYRTAADISRNNPVNVASVPQRSPFRYPGGKTWLIPYIRSWLRSFSTPPRLLIEPFAGGGIVSLTAVMEGLVDLALLVEKDPQVAAVWKAVSTGQASWLAKRIREFDLNARNVSDTLHSSPASIRERAFATILRNRVQRGGIMAPGAGLVKTGENGRGLNSRWYPETLSRRLLEIDQVRERLLFLEGDGLDVIRELSDVEDAVFFVDPPYTMAARRLYQHWQIDHRELFALLARVKGNVLITYDNTREIAELADTNGFETMPVAMKSTHHAKMTELLIGKDLSWLKAEEAGRGSNPRIVQETLALRP